MSTENVVRLSVNLATDVAAALKAECAEQGVTLTEGVRRAIALWRMCSEAQRKGDRIMLVNDTDDPGTYRQILLTGVINK